LNYLPLIERNALDIRFLKTLIDVVEGGSLAEAARRQNLTASAVGQRLKALEDEMGARLINRAGPTVRPTAACLRMMPRLKLIAAEVASLHKDIAEDGLAGPYRLGMISTAMTDHIARLIEHLKTYAPRVDLIITPASSSHLFELLTHSKLDAAVLVEPDFRLPKELKRELLQAQPFAWVTPSGIPAHGESFQNLPLIVYDKASWGGKIAWHWVSQNTDPQQLLCEMDSPETVGALVASGAGRAILPVWGSLSKIAGIDIQLLPDVPRRPIILLHKGSPTDQACIRFFKEFVEQRQRDGR
jgi:DNA-binding transcriptional LysR family regulator